MSSHRLAGGGRLIDRSQTCGFRFDGRPLQGFSGDTLASALLAEGRMLMGRSFKDHRPRGPVAAGAEEPTALVGLGAGSRFEPNRRATTAELFEGLVATSQNRWPSLERDIGVIGDWLSRFLPAGFYYKMFIHPRPLWKYLYEPLIRRSAGLGRAPQGADSDRYEYLYAFCDVLVAGGGIAGLRAAQVAARAGARVIVMEQSAHWGGRAPVDRAEIDGEPADAWIAQTLAELGAMPKVQLRLRTQVAGIYDHGYVLGCERLTDHLPAGGDLPRQRLWRVRAARVVTATGAIERPLAFAGNDLPGVMLASAMRDYVANWAVAPGRRVVVVSNNDDAYRSALRLHSAGVEVAAVLDARPEATGDLPQAVRALGIPLHLDTAISRVSGYRSVIGVHLCRHSGSGGAETGAISCDAVGMSGGWSPAVHLRSHCGGKLNWDPQKAMFTPDPAAGPFGHDGKVFVIPAGSAAGHLAAGAAFADAAAAGRRAAADTGHDVPVSTAPDAEAEPEAPMLPDWVMPAGADHPRRSKMWIDFQNGAKVTDVELAAREGYGSVEHAKRYTTLGMATDQGKLSNIKGLSVLANALHTPVPEVGTTTFRPPWTPVTLRALAGEARGLLFQPLRRTPLHDWHEIHYAHWEPVGQWRRPFACPRPGETLEQAITLEVINTRQDVGILVSSTLGKLLVRGPDAPRFVDMLYTNALATLKPGRCRYGLMCNAGWRTGFSASGGTGRSMWSA